MRNDVGATVLSPDDLCQSFTSFYSSLFSAESIDVAAQESLLNNVESSLPSDQSESCEGLLTVEECLEALTGMARRKAPGLDGLPAEFYLKFWSVLGQDLVQVLNSCYRAGSLTLSRWSCVLMTPSVLALRFMMYMSVALVLSLTCLNLRVSGLGLGPTALTRPLLLIGHLLKLRFSGFL